METQLFALLTCNVLYISDLIYDFPDDDLRRVETLYRYYVLNFKCKLTLTYCAIVFFLLIR